MFKTARKREPGNPVPSNRIESGYPEFTVRGKNKQKKEAKKGIRAYFSSYMRLPARQGKARQVSVSKRCACGVLGFFTAFSSPVEAPLLHVRSMRRRRETERMFTWKGNVCYFRCVPTCLPTAIYTRTTNLEQASGADDTDWWFRHPLGM